MNTIFSGVKILDITKVFSGPFATRQFADYGAEVIKIESEKNFDDSREFPPLQNGTSGYFEILNRNKKGISLDLKNPADLEKFYVLSKDADVIVENLTPSTKHKLKIDYQTIKKLNPRIIYASLSGLGQNDDRKYYDVIAQAESGLMSLSGTENNPAKIGPSVVDAFSGMNLAFAISSALYYREKTGSGQYLDISMLGSAMNLLESNLIEYSVTKQNPIPSGNQDNAIAPFGIYKCADGFIAIAVGNNKLWQKLASWLKTKFVIDLELLKSNHERLQNNKYLTTILESVFKQYKATALVMLLQEIEIPCSKVNTMKDVANSKQNFSNGSLIKINHPRIGQCIIPGHAINFSIMEEAEISNAPQIGEHNKEYGI